MRNLAWDNIVTLINVEKLVYWLKISGYDKEKSKYIVEGFTSGFDIGYRGPPNQAEYFPKYTHYCRIKS